jgi:hypothetical protein
MAVAGDLRLTAERSVVPSSDAFTPLPPVGLPIERTGGQALAHAPEHVLGALRFKLGPAAPERSTRGGEGRQQPPHDLQRRVRIRARRCHSLVEVEVEEQLG